MGIFREDVGVWFNWEAKNFHQVRVAALSVSGKCWGILPLGPVLYSHLSRLCPSTTACSSSHQWVLLGDVNQLLICARIEDWLQSLMSTRPEPPANLCLIRIVYSAGCFPLSGIWIGRARKRYNNCGSHFILNAARWPAHENSNLARLSRSRTSCDLKGMKFSWSVF